MYRHSYYYWMAVHISIIIIKNICQRVCARARVCLYDLFMLRYKHFQLYCWKMMPTMKVLEWNTNWIVIFVRDKNTENSTYQTRLSNVLLILRRLHEIFHKIHQQCNHFIKSLAQFYYYHETHIYWLSKYLLLLF